MSRSGVRATVICITPVKNERWILERFLRCASLWADKIIVVDQWSTDGSYETARDFEKVTVIRNPSTEYDEVSRQRLLIGEARKTEGKRLLVHLDADEILSGNFASSVEWKDVVHSEPGTGFGIKWANLTKGVEKFWSGAFHLYRIFMDDGSNYEGAKMHSRLLPRIGGAPVVDLEEMRVLHYQYTDTDRLRSKHRWYQCWEQVNSPDKSGVEVYRQYHHMDRVTHDDLQCIPADWLATYQRAGIDMTSTEMVGAFWWDDEIIDWISAHGVERFTKACIWPADWANEKQAERLRGLGCSKDPRRLRDKLVHKWLQLSQPRPASRWIGWIDNGIRKLGW